jgi:hypothetical protein
MSFKLTLEEWFRYWVNGNYQGQEAEEVLNHWVQSGNYPQEFLDWYNSPDEKPE